MGVADKLRDLTRRAQDAAAEHSEEIRQAVRKAEVTADQRTGGQYHEQIANAGAKADAYLDRLKPADAEAGAETDATAPASEPSPGPAK